jgi:hypothetical protein
MSWLLYATSSATLVSWASRLGCPSLRKRSATGPETQCVFLRAVFEDAFPGFEGQVQAVELGVVLLEKVDDPQRLQVVLEAAAVAHAVVQRTLSGMAEGCVAEVVRQGDGLGQVLVQAQRAGAGARDLGDLQRMGEPVAEQVALVAHEDLGLVLQASERRAVHDAVAVALEFAAVVRRRLGMAAPTGMRYRSRVRREPRTGGPRFGRGLSQCRSRVSRGAAGYSPAPRVGTRRSPQRRRSPSVAPAAGGRP